MIKKIVCLGICLCLLKSYADTPGKQAMGTSKIALKNIDQLTGYDFYWQLEYDSAKSIISDTTVIIPSSGGAPYNAMFWGVNKATKKSTDTLSFENYYSPDYLITIDTIADNKFSYTKKEIPNNNNSGGYANSDNSNTSGVNPSSKIILFAAVSLIALILLSWFFIRRKNKTQNS